MSVVNELEKARTILRRVAGLAEGVESDVAAEISGAVGRVEALLGLLGQRIPEDVHSTLGRVLPLVREVEGLISHRGDLAEAAHAIEVVISKEGKELRRLDISGLVPAMRQVGQVLVNAANQIDPQDVEGDNSAS